MANNYRVDRVAKEIQREIGEILLREVQDPRVKDVNITDVSLTGDLSQATVFYSLVSDLASDGQKAEAGLTAAKGVIKRSLAKKLTMYKIPDLAFKRDESVAYGDKIDQMLRKLNL